VTDSCQLP